MQIARNKLRSISLVCCLFLLTTALQCDKQKTARTALKTSQDIQLSINSFTRVIKSAQDQGVLTSQQVDLYKPILIDLTNKNEFLNNKAIEWSRASKLPTGARQTLVDTLNMMLDQLSKADALTILHVKNAQSAQSIQALIIAIKTSINSLSLVILKEDQ